MTTNASIVETIKRKVEKLIEENKDLSLQKNQLLAEKDKITKENSALKQKITSLEHKNEALILANGLSGDINERKNAQTKVKKILREIDNCIALINR